MMPTNYCTVRLELAREPAHPEGDPRHGYELVLPLDGDGHIDAVAWKADRNATSVRRFRAGEEDQVGKLGRKPGGSWFFDYAAGDADDEPGFRFNDEAFTPGEYVSIREHDGKFHTFRVVSVEGP